MKLSYALTALMVMAPLAAAAQTSGVPAVPPRVGGTIAPSGTDTPVAPVPGTTASPAQSSFPTVDSSGANQSSENNATGAAMPPAGAPRLPGTPMTPPTGPEGAATPP